MISIGPGAVSCGRERMARGRGMPAVGQPKAPTVTHAARERMLRTLFRYGLTEGSVADLEAQVRALERLPEAQQQQLRGLVRLLGRRNAERDRKWWPLPPEATASCASWTGPGGGRTCRRAISGWVGVDLGGEGDRGEVTWRVTEER